MIEIADKKLMSDILDKHKEIVNIVAEGGLSSLESSKIYPSNKVTVDPLLRF